MGNVAAEKKDVRKRKGQQKQVGRTRLVKIDEIWVGPRMREVDPEAVRRFVASMAEVSLNTPITVRAGTDATKTTSQPWVLVAGAHRLSAAKQLGWKKIRCEIFGGSEQDARIWEVRENLDRAELSALQRAEHYAVLLEAKMEEGVSYQNEAKPSERQSKGGRPEGGLRAAARALDIDNMQASRAMKIAALPSKVKAAIRAASLDHHQAALLKIAKEPNERAQLAKVAEIGRKGTRQGEDKGSETSLRTRTAAWESLVVLTARRLGTDVARFARLAGDTERPEMIRFAAAVQDSRSSNSTTRRRDTSKLEAGLLDI